MQSQYRNQEWLLPEKVDTWDQVNAAILMDIRAELRKLNRTLDAGLFTFSEMTVEKEKPQVLWEKGEKINMMTKEQVFECISKEMEYAKGWGKGTRKISKVEGVDDNDVHSLEPLVGQLYSISDFKTFAKKYWDEIDDALTNFTPDGGAVRIRIIKVLNLLTRALMVHGQPLDIQRLAGVSSSKFPILGGGLTTFNALTSEEGCLIPNAQTGNLRNESPNCNPLK